MYRKAIPQGKAWIVTGGYYADDPDRLYLPRRNSLGSRCHWLPLNCDGGFDGAFQVRPLGDKFVFPRPQSSIVISNATLAK